MESVKIVEICRVAPLPSSSEPKILPLTIFDINLLPFPPTSRLYFYQNSITHNLILPNLKHSLSLILTHYLPLAGNLIWPQHSHKPIIQFLHGDSVSLTVAESSVLDFHHLSGHDFRQDTKYRPLVPQLLASDDSIAAMALQLTIFPNKGFSIGITTHHAIADGNTSTSFMKSWAHLCNNLNIINQEPSSIIPSFYDRTTILNHTSHLEPTSSNRSLKLPSFELEPDSFRCTLELSRQDLQKFKQWALNNNRENPFFHMSSFTLTLAYLLVCTAKLEGLRDGKMHCFIPVDARSRLQPPLPTNYFGNCVIIGRVSVERSELLGENGMLVATEEISKAIQSLEGGVLKELEKKVSQNEQEPIYYIGGSPKFEVYSADFGWGKPVKVELLTIDRRGFALTDTKTGDGGIEIGLVGKTNELERIAALFTQGLEGI